MLSDKISPNIAAAILSGGRNKRMNGRNKAFIRIGGAPFIQKTVKLLKEIFHETFIVTNSPAEYSAYKKDCRIISDEIKDIGPLGGIHAALSKTSKEAVFFVACDMPFLHNGFIRKEIAYFNKSDSDAVVPRITGSIEPLHAIYKRDLRDRLFDFIRNGSDYSIRSFLRTINVSYLDLEDAPFYKKIFKGVNTEGELARMEKICETADENFMQVKSKVWIEVDGKLVFGIGKSSILRAIGRTGSINKAAKEMNMSYRRAWAYIHSAEKRLGRPLLVKVKGGKDGGGAILTNYAENLLEKFEKLEKTVTAFTNKRYKEIFP